MAASGREEELRTFLEEIRSEKSRSEEPALRDLFEHLDAGDVRAGLLPRVIAHVRQHLQRQEEGSEEAYQAFGAA